MKSVGERFGGYMGFLGFVSKLSAVVLFSVHAFAGLQQSIEGKISSTRTVKVVSTEVVRNLLPQDMNLSHQSITPSNLHPIVIVSSSLRDVRELGYSVALGMNQKRTTMVIPFVEINGKIVNYAIEVKTAKNIESLLQRQEATELDLGSISSDEISLNKQVIPSAQGLTCRVSQIVEQSKFTEHYLSLEACF